MRYLLALALSASLALAAVDGTVQNATDGKPQAGATVTLVELGGGMNTIGSTKSDAEGHFKFDATMQPATPYLIQALYEGVTYNRVLAPGTPSSGIAIEIYNAAANVPEAKVSQDMILLERTGNELVVNETVIYTNTGKTTLQSPGGSLKIQVPPEVNTPIKMRVTAPQGLPISREAEKGKEPNTWVVQYPIKPGETRIDFSYSMPATGETTTFAGRILHGGGPVRFVTPQGVRLESPALTDLGPEPRTKASVYELKGSQFAINVTGTGQLRAASAQAEGTAPSEEDNTPGIDLIKPRIFQRLPWILAFSFAMLGVGFAAMYRARG
jgi:hypothetical protein